MPDEKTDHDLLIEINTKLTMFMENFRKHEIEDAAERALIKKDVKAAHRRQDMLTMSGIFSLIVLAITLFLK